MFGDGLIKARSRDKCKMTMQSGEEEHDDEEGELVARSTQSAQQTPRRANEPNASREGVGSIFRSLQR